MNTSLQKRLTNNSIQVLISLILSLIRQLLLIPLFLRAWGSHIYGEWLTLFSLINYVTLFDSGIQVYVINELTSLYAKGEKVRFNEILNTTLIIYMFLFSIIFIFSILFIIIFPINEILNLNHIENFQIVLIIILFIFQIILIQVSQIILGIYRSFGNFPKEMRFKNLQQILFLILSGISLLFRTSPQFLAIIMIFPYLSILVIAFHGIYKFDNEIKFNLSFFRNSLIKKIVFPSFYFLGVQLSNIFISQGTVIGINIILGPEAVTQFSILRTLSNLIRQIQGLLNKVIWPEITRLWAKNKKEGLKNIISLFYKFSSLVNYGVILFVIFLHDFIIRFWIGQDFTYQSNLLYLLFVYVFVQSLWQSMSVFLVATNIHKTLSIATALSGIVGIGFGLVLTRYLNTPGMVLGLLIGDIVTAFWLIPLKTSRLLMLRFRRILLDYFVLLVLFSTPFFAHEILDILGASFLYEFLSILACIILFLIAFTIMILNKTERKSSISFVRSKFVKSIE